MQKPPLTKATVETPQNISSILHTGKVAHDRNCGPGSRLGTLIPIEQTKYCFKWEGKRTELKMKIIERKKK